MAPTDAPNHVVEARRARRIELRAMKIPANSIAMGKCVTDSTVVREWLERV
jgi:hypothetical protein